jgi:hypothetical protein
MSCSLAMDERGGHEDLRASDRRSIIPYIYGRTELYCAKPDMPQAAFSSAHVKR